LSSFAAMFTLMAVFAGVVAEQNKDAASNLRRTVSGRKPDGDKIATEQWQNAAFSEPWF